MAPMDVLVQDDMTIDFERTRQLQESFVAQMAQ